MAGFNENKKKTWKYPNLEYAIRRMLYSKKLPVPLLTTLPDIEEAQNIVLLDHTDVI